MLNLHNFGLRSAESVRLARHGRPRRWSTYLRNTVKVNKGTAFVFPRKTLPLSTSDDALLVTQLRQIGGNRCQVFRRDSVWRKPCHLRQRQPHHDSNARLFCKSRQMAFQYMTRSFVFEQCFDG